MGECTHLEKEDYTLVLKGMIDLSMAVFPKGTAGCQLDALARMPLWKAQIPPFSSVFPWPGFSVCGAASWRS